MDIEQQAHWAIIRRTVRAYNPGMLRHGLRLVRIAGALLVLLLCSQPASAQGPAVEEIESGGIRFKVHAGYGNTEYAFAMPVPNGALARQGAGNTGLAWQLAYNYSVVPVQVSIEHRFPSAFSGRIEVECRNSVSRSEASGNPVLTISREVLVPPATPFQVTLLPRVTPPVTPGAPAWLTVRLFQGENEKPVSVERTYAYQLEPYFLYTLHLDGGDEIVWDDVNPDDYLNLELQVVVPNFGPQAVSPQLLSSRHFCLPAPHRQVSDAPLAARDFAFVVADLQAVSSWIEAEQAGLEAFLQGGGHLCLYNCAGQRSWRGKPLAEPGAVGRGILLPVEGDFAAARQAMRQWLEGELMEFVLLAGGNVDGFGFTDEQLPGDQRLSSRLSLAGLLGLYRPRQRQPPLVDNPNEPYEVPEWPPYEPGYLNPIWIYRESCRLATREPWDYPQFSQPNTRYLSNSYFNLAVQALDEPDDVDIPEPLNQLARAPRHLDWKLAGILAPPVLLALLSLPRRGRRRRSLKPLLGLLLLTSLSWCAWSWFRQSALPAPRVELNLIDLDANGDQQLRRSLIATTRSGQSVLDFSVPQGALLRRISQNPAGDVRWQTTRPQGWRKPQSSIAVSGGADFMALSLDAQEEADPQLSQAVKVELQRSAEGVELSLDTSGLPAGSSCMLQSPLGWQLVPGGQHSFKVYLGLPRLSAQPGPERLRQWERLWQQENNGWSQQLEMAGIGEQSRLLLALRGQLLGGLDTLPRLAWLGVMAQPLSGLAAAELASGRGQAVLWVALPQQDLAPGAPAAASDAAAVSAADAASVAKGTPAPALRLNFLRYSFPLESQS